MRVRTPGVVRAFVGIAGLLLLPTALALGPAPVAAAESEEQRALERERERETRVQSVLPVGGVTVQSAPVTLVRSATINFTELARREAMGFVPRPPVRTRVGNERESEPAEPVMPLSPEALATPPPFVPFVASPRRAQLHGAGRHPDGGLELHRHPAGRGWGGGG